MSRRLLAAVVAELIKLGTLPLTVATALGTIGAASILAAAFTISAPGTAVHAVTGTLQSVPFLQVGSILLGVLTVATEYAGGQVRTTLSAIPNRLTALAAKTIAYTTVVVAMSVATLAAGLVTALVTAPATALRTESATGESGPGVDGTAPPAEVSLWPIVGAIAYLVLIGLLAYVLTVLLRSLIPPLATMLGIVLIGSPLVSGLSEHSRWLRASGCHGSVPMLRSCNERGRQLSPVRLRPPTTRTSVMRWRQLLIGSLAGLFTASAGLAVTGSTAQAQIGDDIQTLQAGPIGWASQNGGTTGGAGGPTVTVTSGSDLIARMQSGGPLTIQVQGTVSLPNAMHDVASDKTIVGLGSNATITGGGGFDIDDAHNVIIHNLTFANGWSDDAINVQDGSTNVWIHHNTFGSGNDGAVDVKRESDFVTVAWNRFTNGHDKTALLGHSDGHTADRGHLRVTYHHNWFDGTRSRMPRVRFGNVVHVFNNYYSNIGYYGVASTMEAGVLVEGNYFENTSDPFHCGEGSSPAGSLAARNNHFVNSGSGQTCGSVGGVPYSYNLDTPSNVRSIVMADAGAG